MSLVMQKQQLRRLHSSLERLNELFSRARPDDPEVQARRKESAERREFLKAQTDGKMKLILLCMTPRSGSSFFCEALQRTGKLGDPGEWFNPHDGKNLDNFATNYGSTSREDMLDQIYSLSATDNGMCVIKGDYAQCQPFLYDELLTRHFDDVRFVAIRREDVLAQAISRYIGTVTGSWASHQEVRKEDVPYDREGIQRQLDFMLGMEEAWRSYFASRAMKPPRITYEQLVRDLPAKVRQVAKIYDVSVDVEVQPQDLRLQKQGSTRNERWAKRFAKETRKVARKHAGLGMSEADLGKTAQILSPKTAADTVKQN